MKAEEMILIEKKDKLAGNYFIREYGGKCLKVLADLENTRTELEKAQGTCRCGG